MPDSPDSHSSQPHPDRRSAPRDGSGDPETIVAISSPPGRGGIGVVRLSGPRAAAISARLFRAATPGTRDDGAAVFGRFVDTAGEPIDHGYRIVFRPPATFTGEEIAELWAHGSPTVLRWLVDEAVDCGARPATPGEFSLRAFLNGRIDATQAEAIHDLIEARTRYQARVAHQQVEGRISVAVNRIKDRLADLVARVEAAIEFSEEPDAERFIPTAGFVPEVRELGNQVTMLAGSYERGRRVRDGIVVAIIGAPNVGKSSLFNRLLEEERAIVTPVAGTTRDRIEETLDLNGIPVTLVDTAGIHQPRDPADAAAVERARQVISEADLLLLLLDWSRPLDDPQRALLRGLDRPGMIMVANKIDLPCRLGADHLAELRRQGPLLEISAQTGTGIEALRQLLTREATGGAATSCSDTFLTNARHRDLLQKAAAALERCCAATRDGLGEECAVLDMREALDRLGEIGGEIGIEGIYDRIFSRFCIGK